MRFLPSITALLSTLLGLLAMVSLPSTVSADEHLRNGNFDQSTQQWVPMNATVTSCAPVDAGTALRLAPTTQAASAIQRINGPLAAGMYKLTGRVIRPSGTQNLQIALSSLDADDLVIGLSQQLVVPSSSYEDFEVELSVLPNATTARLELRVLNSPTVICVDALSLEGPPLATATPEPTNTLAPTSPPATGTTSPSATASATATRTPTPSLAFRNGSFEDGTSGWQNFGGELGVTDATKVSGLYAGVLTSSTTSTKWAYQTVLIDPQRYYEFSGYLLPAAGVSNALLRISWYSSSDGTGEAVSTVDSTTSVPAGASGYAWVTTGPVQPPATATTARVRVLLAPYGPAPATLFMDDFAFTIATPATPTPTPEAPTSTLAPAPTTAPAALTAIETPTTSARAVITTAAPSPEPTRTSEVSSTRLVATVTQLAEVQGTRDVQGAQSSGGVPLIWLVGVGALVAGLGGAYLQGRRKP